MNIATESFVVFGQFGRYGGNEFMLMQQLQQMAMGSQLIYVQLAMVLGLFVVIAFRPERIKFPTVMRWAYLTLIASLVLPLLLNAGLSVFMSSEFFMMSPDMGFNGRDSNIQWIAQVLNSTGPVLLGISMLLAFSSLAISTGEQRPKTPQVQTPPQRHPLD